MNIKEIYSSVAYDVVPAAPIELKSKKTNTPITRARQIFVKLLLNTSAFELNEVARLLNKCNLTVRNYRDHFDFTVDYDAELKREYEKHSKEFNKRVENLKENIKEIDFGLIHTLTKNELLERIFEITDEEILTGKSRRAELVRERQFAIFILRERGFTYTKLGKIFQRDHSTIIHNYRQALSRISWQKPFRVDFNIYVSMITYKKAA